MPESLLLWPMCPLAATTQPAGGPAQVRGNLSILQGSALKPCYSSESSGLDPDVQAPSQSGEIRISGGREGGRVSVFWRICRMMLECRQGWWADKIGVTLAFQGGRTEMAFLGYKRMPGSCSCHLPSVFQLPVSLPPRATLVPGPGQGLPLWIFCLTPHIQQCHHHLCNPLSQA